MTQARNSGHTCTTKCRRFRGSGEDPLVLSDGIYQSSRFDAIQHEIPSEIADSLIKLAHLADSPHQVRIQVEAHREAFLLLTDTWYPGWEAFLDGKPVPHYRANVAFRALPVPRGRYEVVFLYRPASVAWGFRLSGCTLLGVIIWVLRWGGGGALSVTQRTRREKSRPAEDATLGRARRSAPMDHYAAAGEIVFGPVTRIKDPPRCPFQPRS